MALVRFTKLLDRYVFGIAAFLLGFLSFRPRETGHKSIVVIRLWAIGESILVLPMIRSLKERFPEAKITVLTTPRAAQVFKGQGFVDEVLLVSLKSLRLRKFDVAIDTEPWLNLSSILCFLLGKTRIGFSHGARSRLYTHKIRFNDAQHEVHTFGDMLKVLGISKKITRLEPMQYKRQKKVQGFVRKLGKKKIVTICPSVADSAKSRMWPKERFAKLADRLVQDNISVVFIGVGSDKPLIEDIMSLMKETASNMAGRLSLQETIELISESDALVSNDTGPMHIGAAQGTPTLGLFGPNLPTRFAPFGPKNAYLYRKVKCSPCINVHKGSIPECPAYRGTEDYQKCMKLISEGSVYNAVKKLLSHGSGHTRLG